MDDEVMEAAEQQKKLHRRAVTPLEPSHVPQTPGSISPDRLLWAAFRDDTALEIVDGRCASAPGSLKPGNPCNLRFPSPRLEPRVKQVSEVMIRSSYILMNEVVWPPLSLFLNFSW